MTNRHSSPPPRPAPIPASISNPILHQDATRPSSPPRTPQNRRTRIVPSHTAPRVSTRTSRRETFLDDVTPIEGVRGHDGGDERDPHDLAFSPKHVTRASVVDNMLMALDQFSNPASDTVASREPPSASLRYNSIFGRRRANTFSSDISSDNESKPDEHSIPHTFSRTQRSNSNSNYHYPRGLQPVPSLYEEEESNTRHRVFDSQRAFARPDQRHGRKSGKSSGSSSVDLGQVLSNCNLGPAGNRRSQSFDFGSNRPRFPILENDAHARSNSYNLADEIEAAPTPIVHAGPRRGHSPIRHNPAAPLSPIYPSTPGGSKSHTKSSKHQGGRKGRAGTMGNASTKGRDELRDLHENLENLPPMPTYFAPQTHSPTLPPHKPSIASSADLPLHSKERHGFFRRVFGPKNASATTLPPTEGENVISQEAVIVTPTEESFRASVSSAKVHKSPPLKELSSKNPTVPKEQQTITKKSSAFFRRRKKSVCEQMPTSLPLNSLQTGKVEAAEPSPVSSLRQVMNPYLGGPALASPQFAVGNESPQAFHTAPSSFSKPNDVAFVKDEKAQGVTSQSDQSTPNHESLHNQRLRIPRPDHQDSTFLADSSGTEESNSKSRQNSPNRSSDERSRSGPSNVRHNQATEGLLSPRNPSASTTNSHGTNPSSGSQTTRSPTSPAHPDFTAPYFVAPTKVSRPSNLRLQQDTLNPSRRGSSTKEQGTSLAANSPRPSDSDASVYKSAPTTPIVTPNEDKSRADAPSPAISITASPKTIPVQASAEEDQEQALKIFENRDEHLDPGEVSAWLGDPGEARERVRMAYMKLFDWTNMDVLTGLRGLCERIALKGETQQVDRMLDAFSQRWCECNPMHGFKSAGKRSLALAL
jgi:Sec7 domain